MASGTIFNNQKDIDALFGRNTMYDNTKTLDAYVSAGSYYVWSDSEATLDKKFPIAGAAGILVVQCTYGGGSYRYIKQQYTTRSNSHSYIRIYDHNTGTWSSWKEIQFTS